MSEVMENTAPKKRPELYDKDEDLYNAIEAEDAVAYCHKNAKEGEAVLLSPACASWGMFKNYEERGRIFKEIVRGFKE